MQQSSILDPVPQAPDKSGPQARFSRNGVDWIITAKGHYRPLRVGDIEPESRVRPTIPGLEHKIGRVVGLLPGIPSNLPGHRHELMVCVVVEWPPPKVKDMKGRAKPPQPVIRHYRPDQLMVIKGK